MSPKSALLIGSLAHIRPEWESCSSLLKLHEYPSGSRSDFLSKLKSSEYKDLFVIYRSNESTAITGPFDKEMITALPDSVKYICHNGAGYDNIDIPACTERGIQVSSTPVAVNDATADVGMFLILGALRRIGPSLESVKQGKWRGTFALGHDPKNKTLGILGMGGIGSALAQRAKAFGMKIQYHNRHRLPPSEEQGATYVTFDTLLSTSDVLSLNLALNPSTTHIIGAPEFAKMKDGIVIVNTARGPLIDEAALVEALECGKVWSAGLDVFEREPEIHEGLLRSDKVVLLPHMGTATFETQRDMELLVLENLKEAVKNGRLVSQVPEQKKDKS